jgi:hypothetical protein
MEVMGSYDSTKERGPRGILFMGINPTHIPEIINIVYTF